MSMDTTAVAKDLQAKREGELSDLKRNIEDETKSHEVAMQQLRSKHAHLVEELNSQLDNMKRVKESFILFLTVLFAPPPLQLVHFFLALYFEIRPEASAISGEVVCPVLDLLWLYIRNGSLLAT